MSAFLEVTKFIEAQLKAAPAVAEDVVRSRALRAERDVATAVRIYPITTDGQAAVVTNGWHTFTFDVTLDLYARAPLAGANTGDAEAECDALLDRVWARLAGAAAPGGVMNLLRRPRLAWEQLEGETPLQCIRLTVAVECSTTNDTLALRA